MGLADGAIGRFPFADRVADIELIPRHGEIQCTEEDTLNDQHIAQVEQTVRLWDACSQRRHIAVCLLRR